jgi:chemotaxis protein CheZ
VTPPPSEKELNDVIDRAIVRLQSAPMDAAQKQLIETVVASLRGAQATNRKVFEQLSAVMDYIANARREIAAVEPHAIKGQHIPTATDELDAVVASTEEATHKIMDACDALNNAAATLPPEAQTQVTDQVNRIFEACNFQDITGQRITKVVRTLKHIEDQVSSLVAALESVGLRPADNPDGYEKLNVSKATDPEKHLLNGPQAGSQAIKQDEIDKLFG